MIKTNPLNMEVYSFSKDDIQQLKKHGLSEKQVFQQLETFENGIPFIQVIAPANIGNGIIHLSEEEKNHFISIYENSSVNTLKFVPASGAATRMFKLLHQFIQSYDPNDQSLDEFLDNEEFKSLKKFFKNMKKLAFYDEIESILEDFDETYTADHEDLKIYKFIYFLINEIEFSSLPKGLIPFHKYKERILTAFDEHLNEAISYIEKNGKIKLHFTIAEDHLDLFKEAAAKAKHLFKDYHFDISYSYQCKSTDTIAANQQNLPFRDQNGKLFFRPGGHGALIQNLNRMEADLIFIKNIDNVVAEENLELMCAYKKALAGILLEIQEQIFDLLKDLDKKGATPDILERAASISKKYLHHQLEFSTEEEIRDYFNRPIRVCGMVENKGEPGGGPYWIKDQNGEVSLQIVESAQINSEDPKIVKLMENVTHFNPVDLVCGVYDYEGNKFDLQEFVAPNQGFISAKSVDGQPLKALELPGLWNGAMAYWNTIFVEVPAATFNPVKTVADLLRPEHQVSQ